MRTIPNIPANLDLETEITWNNDESCFTYQGILLGAHRPQTVEQLRKEIAIELLRHLDEGTTGGEVADILLAAGHPAIAGIIPRDAKVVDGISGFIILASEDHLNISLCIESF